MGDGFHARLVGGEGRVDGIELGAPLAPQPVGSHVLAVRVEFQRCGTSAAIG
jgi:hypothetical protein